MKNLNAIKADLACHIGSETFTRHGFVATSVATEGAIDYFTQAECFWLWDIIATECHNIIRAMVPEVHYFTIKAKDAEADLKLVDWEDNVLWERHIDFTTHPDGEMELHFGWDGYRTTVCLPSEN